MPTIAVFYGIVIRIYFGDHPPPHVHAIYGGNEALVNIDPPAIVAGRLSRRAESLVLEWVTLRRRELLQAWDSAQTGANPGRVAPVE